MRRCALSLAVALGLATPALADDGGCVISLARTHPDGVGTYTAECRWPVAASHVVAIVGTPGKLAEVTTAVVENTRLPGGRMLNVISAGWPLDDRQSTLALERTELPDGGLLLSYSLAPEQAPLGKGRVQALRNDGRWEIRPDGNGGTRLTYDNAFHAGGSLPLSVVQRAMPERMAKSLREVRAAAEASARKARANPAGS